MFLKRAFWDSVAMQTTSFLARLLILPLLLVATALPAQAGIKSKRVLAAIVERTPAPRIVVDGQQMIEAERAAKAMSGAHVLWGVGKSMEPLYAHRTAVVVAEHDYEKLKKGMTVVYVKRNGMRVAHSIVGEAKGGYLMQGVNNDEEDAELLTPNNFIGVIVDAYAAADTDFRDNVRAQLASKGSIKVANRT